MTMKKYIIPTIEVMKIETESMIAASPESDLNSTDKITDQNQIEAKPHSPTDVDFWDDEEDDGSWSYCHRTKSLWD